MSRVLSLCVVFTILLSSSQAAGVSMKGEGRRLGGRPSPGGLSGFGGGGHFKPDNRMRNVGRRKG